jgi:APA family basic amino acid/polyamine antiporter
MRFDDAPGQARQTRRIGSAGASAIVAGSMLGVGIFLTPRLVAEQVGSPMLFLLLWAAGGLVALAGAVAYAELGTMLSHAGGDYVYLRHTYGPAVGVASGWLLFFGVFCGSIASMAAALCQYQVPVLLSGWSSVDLTQPILGSLTGTQLSAILLVVTLTALNCARVQLSVGVQTLVTLIPLVVLAAVGTYALVTGPHGTAVALADSRPPTPFGVAVAFLGVYFAREPSRA